MRTMYTKPAVSIPFLRPAKTLTAIIALILSMLLGSGSLVAAEQKKDDGGKAKQKWTDQVDDRSIQFGEQQEKKTVDEALSAVQAISKNIQSLKQDVIVLNKDLRLMEEQLLFPSSTKFSIFVSLDSGQFFDLESVKLKIDGKLVATHLYSDKQRQALARGGIQKLFVTNLNEGKHAITAFFTGVGPNGRPYKRAENIELNKGPGSAYIEIAIMDDGALQEPVFEIVQW